MSNRVVSYQVVEAFLFRVREVLQEDRRRRVVINKINLEHREIMIIIHAQAS